jgi:hypothetical protein
MIKGGTNSAGKSGNLRTAYSQQFIPCQLYLLPDDLKSKIENNTGLTWNAYITVEDLIGNTITLTGCSYFQVQKYLLSGIESASLTIEKPEVWSIWGDDYTEVLRPSKRKIKIYAGFIGKEINIFTGRITNATETRGSGVGSLGSINISCNDYRSILNKEESTQTGYETSRYFEIYRLAKGVFETAEQMLVISDQDVWGAFLPTGDAYSATEEAITGQPAWSLGSGAVVVCGNRQLIAAGNVLKITDKHINFATRIFADSTAYNVATARGLVGAVVTEQEVTDAADIVKRGRVVYPQTIGSDNDDLADMVVLCQEVIARSLAGTLSATILFNPYLLPGQIVSFESSRFNITKSNAKIQAVRHQYKHGSCLTALDSIELLTP